MTQINVGASLSVALRRGFLMKKYTIALIALSAMLMMLMATLIDANEP